MRKLNFTGDLIWTTSITDMNGGYFSIKPSVPENIQRDDKIMIWEQQFIVIEYLGGIGRLLPTPGGLIKKELRPGQVFIDLLDQEPEEGVREVAEDAYATEGTVIIGWQCPKCLGINSPWMPVCGHDSCTSMETVGFVIEEGEEEAIAEFLASRGFTQITEKVLKNFQTHLEKAAEEFAANNPGIEIDV